MLLGCLPSTEALELRKLTGISSVPRANATSKSLLRMPILTADGSITAILRWWEGPSAPQVQLINEYYRPRHVTCAVETPSVRAPLVQQLCMCSRTIFPAANALARQSVHRRQLTSGDRVKVEQADRRTKLSAWTHSEHGLDRLADQFMSNYLILRACPCLAPYRALRNCSQARQARHGRNARCSPWRETNCHRARRIFNSLLYVICSSDQLAAVPETRCLRPRRRQEADRKPEKCHLGASI